MKNRIVVLTMLVMFLAVPVHAKTLKEVLNDTTTTKIAAIPAIVVGATVKGVLHLLTLPFYFAEKVSNK